MMKRFLIYPGLVFICILLIVSGSWLAATMGGAFSDHMSSKTHTIHNPKVNSIATPGLVLLSIHNHDSMATPTATPTDPPSYASERANVDPIALGEFTPNPDSNPDPYQGLVDYMNIVGVKPAIHMWFGTITDPFPTTTMNEIAAQGIMPEMTMDLTPYSSQQCQSYDTKYANDPNHNPCTNQYITSGQLDTSLQQYARDAAAWGRPFLYRLGAEMNGNWSQYGMGQNGNTAQSFVAMWQHIVNLFRQNGATNVRWVWSPNVLAPDAPDFAPLYPGNSYVDWVALDGYNFGTTQPGCVWQSFDDIYYQSYQKLAVLTSKPMMIAEISSTEQGGNKADWINQAFFHSMSAYPRIRAIVWFNIDKTADGETDWRVNSSAGALTIYKQVAQSPLYQGRVA